MSLATCDKRYSIQTQRSHSQRHNRSHINLHQNSLLQNECDISARQSHRLSVNTQREGRKSSLREIVQLGYARPPTTVIKPFNLSQSNSKHQHSYIEEQKQSNIIKRSKSPISRKPFVVYRSDKPLTVPKEFNFYGREKKKKVSPKKKKDENLQDILKRLRANSSQKIINANDNKKQKEHSLLIEKFKEFSGREINNILQIRNQGINNIQQSNLNKIKSWK